MVETIGKPVFHRYSGDLFGSWLMDSYSEADPDSDRKIWVTLSTANQTLYEFENKTMYRDNKSTKNYSLPLPFSVNILLTFLFPHFTRSRFFFRKL